MTKRGLAVLYGVAAILLGLSFFTDPLGEWARRIFERKTMGPRLDLLTYAELQLESAARRHVLSDASSQVPINCYIRLYYVPAESSLTDLRVSGISVDHVIRVSMAYASDPPYRGYVVGVIGVATGKPRVWLSGKPIDLIEDETYDSVRGYENLGKQGRLYEANRDQCAPIPTLPDDSYSRTFLPAAGELISWAGASGQPVSEEDFYSKGRWLGTYAVWTTKAERDRAHIDKL